MSLGIFVNGPNFLQQFYCSQIIRLNQSMFNFMSVQSKVIVTRNNNKRRRLFQTLDTNTPQPKADKSPTCPFPSFICCLGVVQSLDNEGYLENSRVV